MDLTDSVFLVILSIVTRGVERIRYLQGYVGDPEGGARVERQKDGRTEGPKTQIKR